MGRIHVGINYWAGNLSKKISMFTDNLASHSGKISMFTDNLASHSGRAENSSLYTR